MFLGFYDFGFVAGTIQIAFWQTRLFCKVVPFEENMYSYQIKSNNIANLLGIVKGD
jgi:hypothetical protein